MFITSTEIDILKAYREEKLTVKEIATKRHTSRQAVYKLINSLKRKGFLYDNKDKSIKRLKITLKGENLAEKANKLRVGLNSHSYLIDFKLGYKEACIYCGYDRVIEMHHIKLKSKGGSNSKDNLMPLCPNCHKLLHKGIISIEEAI